MTYKWIVFENKRHCRKQIFGTSEFFIQCNKDSCCEHVIIGVNIYIYIYIWVCSLLAPECAVSFFYVCVYVFVCIWYQIKVPLKNRIMCQTSINLMPCCIEHTHLSPSCTNVLKLDMCRSIMSLSKLAHQIWWGQPFSQRNNTTERAVGVGIGGDMEGWRGGVGWKNLKKRGRQ